MVLSIYDYINVVVESSAARESSKHIKLPIKQSIEKLYNNTLYLGFLISKTGITNDIDRHIPNTRQHRTKLQELYIKKYCKKRYVQMAYLGGIHVAIGATFLNVTPLNTVLMESCISSNPRNGALAYFPMPIIHVKDYDNRKS